MLKEMDSKSYGTKLLIDIMSTTVQETPIFLSKINEITDQERSTEALRLLEKFKELIEFGNDKVRLATQTYDMVEKHIRRLDEDLLKFEEEQMTGPKVHHEPKYFPVKERTKREAPKKRKVEKLESLSPEFSPAKEVVVPPKKVLPQRVLVEQIPYD